MKKNIILFCIVPCILAGCGGAVSENAGTIAEPVRESVEKDAGRPERSARKEVSESSPGKGAKEEIPDKLAPEGYALIDAQTFEFSLPSGAQAVFASYQPDGRGKNVVFQIEKEGRVLQGLTGYSNLADDMAYFSQVDAVAFADINQDAVEDILIMCTYAYTEESGKAGQTIPMATVYFGNADDSFSFADAFTKNVNGHLEEGTVAALKKYAENYFSSSDGKKEGDIAGMYRYDVDESSLFIAQEADGSYRVELELFRLTYIDDFVGKYENGILTVTGTDAAGNPITAEIAFSGEEAVLTFTDSAWEYLENGQQILFERTS